MTEKEKAAAGLLYNADCGQLNAERAVCKDLCFEFNQTKPSDTERQTEIIKKLFGKIGERFAITAPFYCDYGYNIEAGENLFINHNCVILDCAKVSFGDNVLIGPNCCFAAAGHPTDAEQRAALLEYAHPIKVGNNVWFGAGVTVLPGITIGDNSVIGAGSIVTKDIPPNVIAAGNPCRVIKHL